jgi:hypothetical protein
MNYTGKYLKYKKKYLELKTQSGGCNGNKHTTTTAHAFSMKEEACTRDNCAICLDPLTIPTMAKLYCGHIFHLECIKPVAEGVEVGRKCPECRALIANNYFSVDWNPHNIGGNIHNNDLTNIITPNNNLTIYNN